MPPPNSGCAPTRPVALLALGVWAGIITGFGELTQVVLDLFYSDFVHRSRDALWMIPAFDAGLFALVALLVLLIGRWIPVPFPVAAGLFAGLGSALILLLFERLHAGAALVLAAGIGAQTARLVRGRVAAASRLVRRTLPWLAGSVCLIGALAVGWRAVSETLLVRARPDAAPGSPNVLLLLLDTVRAADLSLYGYPRRTTPKLERLAEGGTVFDRAFAPAPWTLPSHASIFTGRWEFDLDGDWRTRFGKLWPTLAEVLHERGYATAGFVANTEYVAWDSGLDRGFEHYEDYPMTPGVAMEATALGRVVYPWIRQALPLPLARRLTPKLDRHPSAEKISNSFVDWLDRARPAPFFAFLNFMEAHDFNGRDLRHLFRSTPLRTVSDWEWSDTPPVRLAPTDVRRKQDAYDNAIAYLDSELGRLFSELERRQLLNNTLVIVTADHGEEFAEHGLVSHGHSLYRYSLHVPLVLWIPGRVAEGRRVAAPVSLRNLAATILELVNPGRPALLPGRSLTRFWTRADTAPDTIVASMGGSRNLPCWYPVSRGAIRSIAFDGWRYIRNDGDGAEELYDFENDLLERWNLADSDSGRRVLRRYRAELASLSKPRRSTPDCRD